MCIYSLHYLDIGTWSLYSSLSPYAFINIAVHANLSVGTRSEVYVKFAQLSFKRNVAADELQIAYLIVCTAILQNSLLILTAYRVCSTSPAQDEVLLDAGNHTLAHLL